ncbi:hypothetical protein SAMN05443637_114126 [Pseudonocardia thermophila]|jgi:hypothetical protein|uniref:Ogr/Delta-like zinc finger n=1 Tax=Pseudonocardia thermophila TaxID=1848 RepID=A0A1M6WEM8_PSETH|nr:hypothetical protein SAMN05443637_114126 [Pseudonocardia thermophila]
MRCASCGWPTSEAKVLSTHRTSEGWVRYRRCMCGAVAIELLTLTGEPTEEPVRIADARERVFAG